MHSYDDSTEVINDEWYLAEDFYFTAAVVLVRRLWHA